MNSMSNGVSGSPLYKFHKGMKKALAIGVHVGGGRVMGYAAVPLSKHIETVKSSFTDTKKSKIPSKYLPIFVR